MKCSFLALLDGEVAKFAPSCSRHPFLQVLSDRSERQPFVSGPVRAGPPLPLPPCIVVHVGNTARCMRGSAQTSWHHRRLRQCVAFYICCRHLHSSQAASCRPLLPSSGLRDRPSASSPLSCAEAKHQYSSLLRRQPSLTSMRFTSWDFEVSLAIVHAGWNACAALCVLNTDMVLVPSV